MQLGIKPEQQGMEAVLQLCPACALGTWGAGAWGGYLAPLPRVPNPVPACPQLLEVNKQWDQHFRSMKQQYEQKVMEFLGAEPRMAQGGGTRGLWPG